MSQFNILELLQYIDPSSLSYQEWIGVGMALHYEGHPVTAWDNWSQGDPKRYHPGECEKKWQTFGQGLGAPVTGAYITQMAKDFGWQSTANNSAMKWDDIISEDVKIIDTNWIEGEVIKEPGEEWNGVIDLIRYLELLFDSSDIVGYVTESWEKDGKFMPTQGNWGRTAGQLIQELSKQKKTGDIGAVLGDYNEACGAWIRFNPLDGNGCRNENVTDFRYALVESDSMGIEQQNEVLRRLELPIKCLVHSGGKSLHALIHIDAANKDEYRKRVDYVYSVCAQNGLHLDTQNRNPSRLSRMPGVTRQGHKQFIVDTDIGFSSFQEWKEWIESVNDNLPEPDSLADVWDNLPELSPPLISGVLRQGHKMLIAGPSKAGKSFLLITLTICLAEGIDWLGFPCTKSKVQYINLELDRASCLHRFKDVYQALGIEPKNLKNIDIWNLRGKSVPMDKLAPKLIRRAQKKNYGAIIIDPIYKVITGDENSAEQMSNFCNQFDKVCTDLGCAVIYCHHHSKGYQGSKRSMDRASGSGVFARDPDALLDLVALDVEEEKEIEMDHKTAWRLDATLREYPRFEPINVWFEYPIHRVDESGFLRMAAAEGESPAWKKGVKAVKQQKLRRQDSLEFAFACIKNNDGYAEIEKMADYMKLSTKTIRRYLNESGNYKIDRNRVFFKGQNQGQT